MVEVVMVLHDMLCRGGGGGGGGGGGESDMLTSFMKQHCKVKFQHLYKQTCGYLMHSNFKNIRLG